MSILDQTGPRTKTVEDHAREWVESYGQGAYMLALADAQDIVKAAPEVPDGWFALGVTHVALRDLRRAREAFEKAAACTRPGGHVLLGGDAGKRMGAALQGALGVLGASSPPRPPKEALRWLTDPASIGEGESSDHCGPGGTRLGRVKPLIDPASLGPLGSASNTFSRLPGVLGPSLSYVAVPRDSMASLLGKDAGLKIEQGKIIIRDGSVKIDRMPLPEVKVFRSSGQARDEDRSADVERAAVQSRIEESQRLFEPPPRPEAAETTAKAAAVATLGSVMAAAAAARGAQAARTKPPAPAASPARSAAAPAAAVAAATAAATSAEDRWRAWEEEIERLATSGRLKEAAARVEAAVAKYPESPRLRELDGAMQAGLGNTARAAKAWAEAHARHMKAGSTEKADAAMREALALARENGDLLIGVAGLMAAGGGMAAALAAAEMAADVYRRQGDRPKLTNVLQSIVRWGGSSGALQDELRRLTGVSPQLADAALQAYEAVSPPSTRTTASTGQPWTAPEPGGRAARAANARIPGPGDALARKGGSDSGLPLLFGAIVVLFLTLFTKTPVFGVLGFLLTAGYLKLGGGAGSQASAKTARALFIVAAVLGLIL